MCGGHRGLAHPHSEDSLLPTRHLLINTGTDSRVKWRVENFGQSVCVTRSECSKQAAGNIQCARGKVVCARVYCVSGNTYQSKPKAETTHVYTIFT